MIYIDSLGHTFNTAKEAAKFWGVRESSILKYINGEKPFLFSGKRSKAEVSDVYFAVVERTAINSQADLDAAISLAEIFAWQDQQSCGDYSSGKPDKNQIIRVLRLHFTDRNGYSGQC